MTYLVEYKARRGATNRDVKAIELLIEADKKIEELDRFNLGLATESHYFQTKVEELKQKIVNLKEWENLEMAALKEWQRKAFECYPNIDLDIENLTENSQGKS